MVGLTIFVGRVFVIETSDIIYSVIVEVSWIVYSYFKGLVFFLSGIPTLLVVIIFLNISFVYTFGNSILRRVVPFLRSSVDDGRVSRDVTNVYCFDFFIGIVLNKMTLLPTL